MQCQNRAHAKSGFTLKDGMRVSLCVRSGSLSVRRSDSWWSLKFLDFFDRVLSVALHE